MLEDGLLQILEKVRRQKDFDFREYKETTLKRRIERRLRAKKAQTYQQYTEALDADPDEYTKLIDDITIKVTEFFRNPQAWQILKEEVLPEIIKKKIENGKGMVGCRPTLRIWCAGCATGEEVYSAAIAVKQLLAERGADFEINIWGTDIDKASLIRADCAEYKHEAAKTIAADILNEYFDLSGGFRVKPDVRDGVYFKSHDLVLDEPLKQMDMVICRNVAIYFTRPLQEKVFMDFYNSLDKEGYLFLGKAETLVGSAKDRFEVVNKRWKIYRKINN
jgi:chemotaxis methyl-accepting protein methylase